ncbi:hypothetical protein C4K68_25420 [Pokkaliibacter plantistimulans]|uniref:HAD family hydrolase n=1 Tax=Proteobacteria bacterium 228 TaxID=2083153 RepID=A0A2S5KJX6_9PROT|nr:hypothetical protein C4K68_25420 [Pokkaliibacter plantistimulans]
MLSKWEVVSFVDEVFLSSQLCLATKEYKVSLSKQQLQDFGVCFIGPVLAHYFRWLGEQVSQYGVDNLLFLAREGYFLKQGYERLRYQGLVPDIQTHYLLASRTFLYRAMLDRPECWELALQGAFSGNLKQLCEKRLGLMNSEVDSIFSPAQKAMEVVLPDDKEKVIRVFKEHVSRLAACAQPTKDAYLRYSAPMLSSPGSALVDLGYSGTIQKLITLLHGTDTRGFYWIATRAGEVEVGQCRARMHGALKEGVALGQGYIPLDRSLFLEAVLTSPNGQLKNISVNSSGKIQMTYGGLTHVQRHFHELEVIMAGAMSYAEDMLRSDVVVTGQDVENIYAAMIKSFSNLSAELKKLFDIDDDNAGLGVINPLTVFA